MGGNNLIPVFKPLLEKEEFDAAINSLRVGWLGMGKSVELFENEIKKIIKDRNKKVVAVNTGFSALHLSCVLLNLKKGDEVILPSFTNIADIQSVLLTGAKPVMCDILENTFCIDPDKIKKLITKKTKAIIPIDYGCNLAEHDEIKYIAKKNGLRIIHDAAHSLGSSYKKKKIGSFSEITMFSFDPVKSFTCIDGGAIVVSSEKDKQNLHELRIMGMQQKSKIMYKNKRSWTYDVRRMGYRYHLANLHAAVGLSQLKKINKIKQSRKKSLNLYNKHLVNEKQLVVPIPNHKNIIPFHYCLRIKGNKRDELIKYLKKNGIDAGIHWKPNHKHSLLKNYRSDDLKITNKIYNEILSLPFFTNIRTDEIVRVCNTIKKFINKHS